MRKVINLIFRLLLSDVCLRNEFAHIWNTKDSAYEFYMDIMRREIKSAFIWLFINHADNVTSWR